LIYRISEPQKSFAENASLFTAFSNRKKILLKML